MKNILLILVLINFQIVNAQSVQTTERICTSRFTDRAPVIDGRGDDDAWKLAEWNDKFIQYSPYENTAPAQSTQFKILNDKNNLYVLVRASDSEPTGIDRRITRRDMQEGDLISIQFDSYHDHLTAFVFCVSASEVKTDKILTNDGKNEDLTWDPVWYVRIMVDQEGWVAEFKIPLSQLRFNKNNDNDWGLQVVRTVFRNQETSVWKYIPRDATGWVHNFGKLTGLENINPKRQIEIAPYAVSKTETRKPDSSDPFVHSKKTKIYGGLDGKIGLTNDVTLDFTVNPDFGQVENDPSVVNLTSWETYFEEKRPFFIEGRNLFDFNTQYGDNLFYSRRIGRSPQGSATHSDFSSAPLNTTILGALKVTGKTKNGISLAVLESVTDQESALTKTGDIIQKQVVEPYTNYFISRVQKDYGNGNTRVGAMITSTNRDKANADNIFLHTAAYTAGIDFNHNWKEKTWYVNLRLVGSRVEGSRQTILRTQLSPLRYYQRPDAPYVHLDSTLTSLMGQGGMISFGKAGGGNWNFETMLNWHSPGLETNDVGYLQTTDEVVSTVRLVYNCYKPVWIFRNFNAGATHLLSYNYGLIFSYESTIINTSFLLKNFWNITTSTELNSEFYSNSTMRGGPILKLPGNISQNIILATDPKKVVSASFGILSSWGGDNATSAFKTQTAFTFRLTSSLNIGLEHEFSKSRNEMQYVATKESAAVGALNATSLLTKRYIFATARQLTNRFSMRVSYNITPDLAIQYYGQPFISSVGYSDYKRVTDPRAEKFDNRFSRYLPGEIEYNETDSKYLFDENGDGTPEYEIRKPDFKLLDFISNLVVRWEYRPGSTIYFVWAQGRKYEGMSDNASFRQDLRYLANIFPGNNFIIKFSYRFH
jgi:hypothetical protein